MDKIKMSLSKWGNSNAIRIPVEVLKQLNIQPKADEAIDLIGSVVGNKFIIEKEEKTSRYEKLFENFKGETSRNLEFNWKEDLGREIIE